MNKYRVRRLPGHDTWRIEKNEPENYIKTNINSEGEILYLFAMTFDSKQKAQAYIRELIKKDNDKGFIGDWIE